MQLCNFMHGSVLATGCIVNLLARTKNAGYITIAKYYSYSYSYLIPVSFICRYSCMHKLGWHACCMDVMHKAWLACTVYVTILSEFVVSIVLYFTFVSIVLITALPIKLWSKY